MSWIPKHILPLAWWYWYWSGSNSRSSIIENINFIKFMCRIIWTGSIPFQAKRNRPARKLRPIGPGGSSFKTRRPEAVESTPLPRRPTPGEEDDPLLLLPPHAASPSPSPRLPSVFACAWRTYVRKWRSCTHPSIASGDRCTSRVHTNPPRIRCASRTYPFFFNRNWISFLTRAGRTPPSSFLRSVVCSLVHAYFQWVQLRHDTFFASLFFSFLFFSTTSTTPSLSSRSGFQTNQLVATCVHAYVHTLRAIATR
jgi:hypothetical protein